MDYLIPIKNVKDIGNLMKNRRKDVKLTQRELAGLCSVGVRFISELENGKKTLEIEKVLKVAKNLGFDFCFRERKIIR
ncbi:MAG: type II toxin-antitoxin system Y4mF family antitoxin [bacterium]